MDVLIGCAEGNIMATNFLISEYIPNNYSLSNKNWSSFVFGSNYFSDILDETKYTTLPNGSSGLLDPFFNMSNTSTSISQNSILNIKLGSFAADTFDYRNSGNHAFAVDADQGANAVYGGANNNYVKTGIGADTINLTSGDNIIISDAGANTITVTFGDNLISTGLGADNITATDGDNFINAGDGANAITVTSGDNIIVTGKGADSITTAGFLGTVNVINAGNGANTITTGAGNDHITGGIHADTITSGAGDDIVYASDGANTITTGAGNDLIYTGKDVDTVSAGTGNDTIHIYGGTDTISAGTGNDTLIAHFGSASQAVSINALTGDATEATGYSGNISGFGVASFLGVNNFNITSGVAADIITTGAGADTITGGAGADILTGGDGADIFVINTDGDPVTYGSALTTADGTLIDVITDFNTGGTDIIRTVAADSVAGVSATTTTTATSNVAVSAGGKVTFDTADVTLAEKIVAIAADGTDIADNEIVFFEDGGNTYVYAAGDDTVDVLGDSLIQLTGVTGLTTMSEAVGGDFTIA
jgi:Ca2+-binding RTX toxin-like protein